MRTTLLCSALLIALSAAGEERLVYPRPDPSRIVVKRNNVYRADLQFDLYRPAGSEVVPVVIFANIGSRGYTTFAQYTGWGEIAAGAGLAGVVYQATEENAISDFDALAAALRERAKEFRIDPARVVVWSCSANVQVGLPVAMDRKRDFIRAAVVYYGAADVPEIRSDLPLFLVRAGLDSSGLNKRIDAMIARALSENAPWTVESYGAGVHGFDLFNDNDVSRDIMSRTLSFMKSALRLSSTYALLGDRATIGAAFSRGDWQAAIDGYRRINAIDDNDAESHRRLGLALLETKEYAAALTELERAYTLGRRGTRDTVYPAARAAAGAGNLERTIYWLDQALQTRFGPPIEELKTSDVFASLRATPAFQQLLAKYEKK